MISREYVARLVFILIHHKYTASKINTIFVEVSGCRDSDKEVFVCEALYLTAD